MKLQDGTVLVIGGDAGVIQSRMLHFAVPLDDGTVLVCGGQDDTGDILASAERFNPATNTFTPVSDMPVSGSEQAAVSVTR